MGDEAIGTVRVHESKPKTYKLGRLAVLSEWRGKGVGKALMVHVHMHMRAYTPYSMYMHAQIDKLDFYARLGYKAQGEVFMEEGIAHIVMWKHVDYTDTRRLEE